MKIEQMRALGDQDLAKELEEAHRELFTLRFRLATRQLANHQAFRGVKKKIARIKTVLRERQLFGSI